MNISIIKYHSVKTVKVTTQNISQPTPSLYEVFSTSRYNVRDNIFKRDKNVFSI